MNKSKLVIVTLATHSEGYFDALQKSCTQNSIRLVVLGWQQPWRGYAWKFHLMRDFLKKETEGDAESSLYVFADAFDVIPRIENEERVIERFYSVGNGKIIIGVNDKPRSVLENIQYWLDKRIFGTCFNKSLNSGVYVGTREQIVSMLDLCSNDGHDDNDDDQRMLVRACNNNDAWFSHNVHFDTDASFVLNVTCALSSLSKHRFLTALEKNVAPVFFHGAGHCNMNELTSRLDLPNYKKVQKSNRGIIKRILGKGGYARYVVRSAELMTILFFLCIVSVLLVVYALKLIKRRK